jgi:hypothetical protein
VIPLSRPFPFVVAVVLVLSTIAAAEKVSYASEPAATLTDQGEAVQGMTGKWFGNRFGYVDAAGKWYYASATFTATEPKAFLLGLTKRKVTAEKGDLFFRARNGAWYLAAAKGAASSDDSTAEDSKSEDSKGGDAKTAGAAAPKKPSAASVKGRLDPTVCWYAQNYANTMAFQSGQDGHAGFDARFRALGSAASEITAESWGWERTLADHARECVKSWQASAGHRASMMAAHPRYCYAMAPSRNGKYYCVGLFAR